MPEGDTIFRVARTLHGALAGKTVVRFSSSLPRVATAAHRLRLVGQTVAAVEPRGKHLLMRFSGGSVLHTHMRMTGSWHVYPAGTPWRRPAWMARVVLETGEAQAVCFAAPIVELLSPREAARHPSLTSLGQDVLAAGFDPVRTRDALRARGDQEIAVALLDQTALAGIGNVYKSEVLFLVRVNPCARVDSLSDETLDRLVTTARAQMQRNLGPGARRTTSSIDHDRHWVYRRGGRPCRRCGTAIRRRLQGEQARSTYWCPRCQPG